MADADAVLPENIFVHRETENWTHCTDTDFYIRNQERYKIYKIKLQKKRKYKSKER